jgi:gas vesicle protein
MDEKIIVKQMIDFHKSTFQNSYNAIVMLQDQTEKMLSTFLSQANWVPQDFKKVMGEWTTTYKKGRDEFKKSVDENFKRVDDYFSAPDKPQPKTKHQ